MNDIATAIQTFFAGASSNLSAYLAALTAIGIATMALIQAAKDVLPVRRWFQDGRLNKWLAEGAEEAGSNLRESLGAIDRTGVDPSRAREQLIKLSVDGDADALLDLSVEQLAGQMTAALQMALDYPNQYADLLLVAASAASDDDVKRLLTTSRSPFANGAPDVNQADRTQFADSRNRVQHQLQRAVDGFQIATGFRWKFLLQITSFLISAVLAAIASAAKGDQQILAHAGVIVFTAIMAGFFAPVARDLTAALQKLRNP